WPSEPPPSRLALLRALAAPPPPYVGEEIFYRSLPPDFGGKWPRERGKRARTMGVLRRMTWRDNLPAVRGKLLRDEPIGPFTWLRVGGPADVLFLPADVEDLAAF